MRSLYDVPAPAKLNLFLHITGRRADGYHLLQSVFMLVDWCDTLHFERRSDAAITREDLNVALPELDLTLRAAQALQKATGCSQGAHIGVLKSIPSEAGMGGGSSDAATTLLALNRLWGLNLPCAALAQIGVNIAPLLAGAGVIGLAIGFGAQKLVEDIITGIFIQFENIMNEGDVVEVAGDPEQLKS